MKRFLAVLLVAVMLLSVLPATSMAASYATVVGGWLRLRSAPNFSASTITSYYTGTQVQILSSSGGWYKVQTPDGRTGYMYGDYLRVGGSIPSEGTAYVTSYNGYGVRLRTGPGTGYRIIRTYAVGTPVTVLERGTYWSRISIGGTVGYMMSQFLHFGSDYPDDGNVLCYATIWSSNGYGVRLRTGPSKSYSKIGVYSVGTKVAVLQKGAVWDRIRVGSRVGWMMNEFLIYHENNEVTSVTLNNYMPVVGSVLSMQAVSPSTATVSYEWLVGGVLKSTNTTYTVDANDVGKTIQLRVTGTGSYKGTVTSAATNAVISNTVLTGVTLNTIAPVVGDVMTATLNPAGASVIYAWKVGGYQVSNAATYTVTANDVGKQIELIVTGTGVYSGTQSSGLTAAVSASRAVADVTIRNDSNPTAGAAPSVGDKLTAVPSPAQATVTYQWNRDGAAISGATAVSYTVAAEDTGCKLSVTVTGTGSYTGTDTSSETAVVVVKAPELKITVPTFDNVLVGYEQPVAQPLTIANSGTAAATITSVACDNNNFTITEGNKQIAASTTDTSWTIQPAKDLSASTYNATVTVTYDGGVSATASVSFTVNAPAPVPVSELVIGNVAFDPLQEGYAVSPEAVFTVSNKGNTDLTVESVYLDGPDANCFTYATTTATIKAGETDSTTYTVQPNTGLTESTYTATLKITYGGGKTAQADVSFTVTNGTPAAPLLDVSDVDFSSVVKGSAPVAQRISITNNGGSTATVTQVYLTGDNAGSFTVSSSGSSQIAVGGQDTSWTVQPNAGLAAGTYTAQINVEYNNSSASPATATVNLEITEDGTPSTAVLTVGKVEESQPADNLTPVALTITNSSDVDAVIESVTVSDVNNFTTNYNGSSSVAAHGSDTSWKVTLKAAPKDGDYSTYAIVTYNSGAGTETKTAEAVVTINVTRATQTGLSDVSDTGADTGDVVDGASTSNDASSQMDLSQQTYSESTQQSAAEPEPQAPAQIVLAIQQTKSSVTKGKTLQLTALMNDQAIAYDSNNDEAYPILWTLSGANSKRTSISASGLLTVDADETATSLTVTATLKSDANHFSTVNLQVKEAQTTETTDTADTAVDTIINEDGTNDIMMESLEMIFNQ